MWEKHLKRCLNLSTLFSLGSVQHLGIPRRSGNKSRQIPAKAAPQQPPGEGQRALCTAHTSACFPQALLGRWPQEWHHLTVHFQSPGLFGGMGRQAAPDTPCPVDIVTQDKREARSLSKWLKTGNRKEKTLLLPCFFVTGTKFC